MPDVAIHDELDDVFDLVADETRLDILRALWTERALDQSSLSGGPVPFSTLRETVGVRDSGRFNYHLDKLTPFFVRNRDDGYALTNAGARVIGAAVSGVYTEADVELEDTPMGPCSDPACSGTVVASYETGRVTIACDTCDSRSRLSAPPILVGAHDLQGDPDVLAKYALTVIQQTIRGFCNVCQGPTDPSIDRSSPSAGHEDTVGIAFECRACGSKSYTSAISLLLDHPGIIAALDDLGIDYRYALVWQEADAFDWTETLRDDGTIEIVVTVPDADQRLTAILDETFSLREFSLE